MTSSPAGINCGATCSATYDAGAGITLSASASAGSIFAGWSGACAGQGSTCSLSLTSDQSTTAIFAIATTLTVTRSGPGTGIVTSSPAGINCGSDCSDIYPQGATVTLTAVPASGGMFQGWSGACSGSAPTCTVTMSASKSVNARFRR